MRHVLILGVMAATLLAGCSEGEPPSDEEDLFEDQPDRVATGKGVIRGVVVDPAIVPVPEATVRLASTGEETSTDENGAFFLSDVEPGSQFLTVSKVGWSSVQQSVQVEPDVARPPIVRVMLEPNPEAIPRAPTYSAEGFLQCGIGTPLTLHTCPVLDDQDRSTIQLPFTGAPDWIQSEVMWESTQPTGEQLYIIAAVCDDPCGFAFSDRYDEGVKDAPSVARTEGQGRSDMVVGISVSPGGPANGTGVALDQDFYVYATFFYNIEDPDGGWTFLENGDYPA